MENINAIRNTAGMITSRLRPGRWLLPRIGHDDQRKYAEDIDALKPQICMSDRDISKPDRGQDGGQNTGIGGHLRPTIDENAKREREPEAGDAAIHGGPTPAHIERSFAQGKEDGQAASERGNDTDRASGEPEDQNAIDEIEPQFQ